jgi:O-antigen ligase
MLPSERDCALERGLRPPSRIASVPTLIAAFVFGLPLVVIPGNDDPASLPQSAWLQVGVLLLWIARLAGSAPCPTRAVVRPFVPLGVFLAWSVASLAWATDTHAAIRVLGSWVAASGLALLIADVVRSEATGRRVLYALYASAVTVSFAGLLQHLAGWEAIPQAFPPAGTLGNKNVAAEFVATALPAGGLLFLAASTPLAAMAVSGGFGVALAFIFHTGCRAAWLALLVVSLVVAVWRLAVWRFPPRYADSQSAERWSSGFRRVCLVFGALVFALLATRPPADQTAPVEGPRELIAEGTRPILRTLGAETVAATDRSEAGVESRASRSVSLRLHIWSNTLEMIHAAPWMGVGVSDFSVHYPRFARSSGPDGTTIDQRVDEAHNDFLQGAAETGLIGTLAFAWAVSSLLKATSLGPRTLALWRLGRTTGLAALALGVIAALSPVVTQPALLGVAGISAGLAQAAARIAGDEALVRVRRSAWGEDLRQAGLTALAAALVVVASWGVVQIKADRHVLRMAQAESRGDWPAVAAEGLLARKWNPARTDPRFAAASALLRLNEPAAAAKLLQELLRATPYHANALGNLAIAHMRSGELPQAQRSLERLLKLRPDDAIALSLIAQVRAGMAARDPELRRP